MGWLDCEPIVVLNVGARGANLHKWKSLGPNLRYCGFEPDEEECRRLNEAAARKDVPWEERYFPIALGKDNGERVFYVTENPECSSLLEPNSESFAEFPIAQHVVLKHTVAVSTYSLSHWAQLYSNPVVDFIELDVQGAELEVLQGAQDVLNHTAGLLVEVEFIEVYKNQPLFGEVNDWMRSQGFILFDILPKYKNRLSEKIESLGQLVWGDALYLRDVRSLFTGPKSPDQHYLRLLKLAAIADLFERPDYALYALERATEEYPEYLGEHRATVTGGIPEIRVLLGHSEHLERGEDLKRFSLANRFGKVFSKLSHFPTSKRVE